MIFSKPSFIRRRQSGKMSTKHRKHRYIKRERERESLGERERDTRFCCFIDFLKGTQNAIRNSSSSSNNNKGEQREQQKQEAEEEVAALKNFEL